MKHAAIYTANPERLTGAALSSIAAIRGLQADKKKDPTAIQAAIDGNKFQINAMQEKKLGPHLAGLQAYIKSYHAQHPVENLEELLAYSDSICCVYGFVFAAEFEFHSATWQVVKELADLVDGVIFVCDSLVDTEGMVVFGPLGEE